MHSRILIALLAAALAPACASPPPSSVAEAPASTDAARAPAAEARVLGVAGPLAISSEPSTTRFRSFFGGNLPARTEAKSCRALPDNLRGLFYEHFVYYVDRHGKRISASDALAFSRLLARAWSESHGNPTNAVDARSNGNALSASRFVTDNIGRPPKDNRALSSLESRAMLLRSPRIHMDRKTRFGLLKASAAQLSDPAARAALSEIQGLALRNPDAAIDRCGSQWMYLENDRALKTALIESSRCKAGSATESEVRCFARWVTLCPSLNLTLALIKDRAAGARNGARSACSEAFKSLLAP